MMALLRIKTIEGSSAHQPGELGILLGLDRMPEVQTLRRKLAGQHLLALIDEAVIPEARRQTNGDRALTLIFDRQAWSPKSFRRWQEQGIDVITDRKGKQTPWDASDFHPRRARRADRDLLVGRALSTDYSRYRQERRLLDARNPLPIGERPSSRDPHNTPGPAARGDCRAHVPALAPRELLQVHAGRIQ
jgi:hypothetical protein